jgi:hypothetical protein
VADEDQADEDDEHLTDEEKQQRKEQKDYDQMVRISDDILNRWTEAQPEDARQSVIDSYIETGTLDHTVAGVDEIETTIVQAAFASHVQRQILAPLGMTIDQWSEHIDEAELPDFRRAVVNGDWQLLTDHARATAKMRLDLGI